MLTAGPGPIDQGAGRLFWIESGHPPALCQRTQPLQTRHVRPPAERQLTRRFGPLPPEAVDRIHQAALPQLET
jgi:mRNA-degrading endonuclease toxin of MazEF toxin-antitoxin module